MHLNKTTEKLLLHSGLTLSVAESCTGGLLADTLTNIPGSSAFFLLGVVAYDNDAKIRILKVPSALIKKHGAVSAAVAQKMAQGVRRILNTDLGVGITGVAGPGGATAGKPVGTVFIAVSRGREIHTQHFHFKGNRRTNKAQAVKRAVEIIKAELA